MKNKIFILLFLLSCYNNIEAKTQHKKVKLSPIKIQKKVLDVSLDHKLVYDFYTLPSESTAEVINDKEFDEVIPENFVETLTISTSQAEFKSIISDKVSNVEIANLQLADSKLSVRGGGYYNSFISSNAKLNFNALAGLQYTNSRIKFNLDYMNSANDTPGISAVFTYYPVKYIGLFTGLGVPQVTINNEIFGIAGVTISMGIFEKSFK